MQALLSILPQPHYDKIYKIWDDLETKFGIKWVKNNISIPHLTWNVAENYNIENFTEVIKTSIKTLNSITIKTQGLGLFTGDKITLYLPIKPTKELLEFHLFLWNLVNVNNTKLNKYYSPTNWIPHITLAVEDINKENVGTVVSYLSKKKLKLQIKLESVSVVRRDIGKEIEIENTYGIPRKSKKKSV
ncbi:MAG TPA: hypothetical protein GXX68_06725 [Defluviitoga tunisiensis]|nr:hypothetical protein [Defluviitoga tunisiensis]